jgi:AraC family transcriptional regulator
MPRILSRAARGGYHGIARPLALTRLARRQTIASVIEEADLALRHGIVSHVLPVERILFASPLVCLGEFRCSVGDADFRGGICSGHTIVFPREALWIQHAGSRRFVADPTRVTFYNRGQEYRRFPLSNTDRCDWLAFPDRIVRNVVADVDGSIGRDPFPFGFGPSHPHLYLRQRRLFARCHASSRPTPLDVEESALDILHGALRRAFGTASCQHRRYPRDVDERLQHVRALLATGLDEHFSLSQLADAVDLSPYHLSRTFHRISGITLATYRTWLRVLHSLEPVADGADLSAVAQDLGFSSHSHFTYAFRRAFTAPPSAVRASLNANT